MSWKAKKEYAHVKYERADQRIYEPKWDFIIIFWILELRTNQNKIFKSYLEAPRQQFTMRTKNRLRWRFLLVAKAMIHVDKRRIQ